MEYVISSQKEYGANRLLASEETKATNKKSQEIDNRLANHNQNPEKSKNQPETFTQLQKNLTKKYKNIKQLVKYLWTLSFERKDGDAQTEFIADETPKANTDAKKRDLQAQKTPEASTNEQTPAATDAKKDDAIKSMDLSKYENNGFATSTSGHIIRFVSIAMAALLYLV